MGPKRGDGSLAVSAPWWLELSTGCASQDALHPSFGFGLVPIGWQSVALDDFGWREHDAVPTHAADESDLQRGEFVRVSLHFHPSSRPLPEVDRRFWAILGPHSHLAGCPTGGGMALSPVIARLLVENGVVCGRQASLQLHRMRR